MVFMVIQVSISLVTDDAQHLFMYLIVIYIYSLKKNQFRSSSHVLNFYACVFACMYICVPHICCVHGVQKKASDFLEPELEMIVNYYIGAKI